MELLKNYEKAVKNIRAELKKYLNDNKIAALILGQSGGIDSTLCLVLARPVCDELNIPLISRSITIVTNKADERCRAEHIGRLYATDFEEINLSATFFHLQEVIAEDIDNIDHSDYNFKIRMGNLKARIRMMYLYDLAAKNKGMVLSTDNYTELLLGFWTLHGDVGDYGMIQSLWKTEVYQMSEFLAAHELDTEKAKAIRSCIIAPPTDGLGITNTDLDQIGASSYQEVDEILYSYLYSTPPQTEAAKKVIARKIASEYKRNNPFNIPRQLIDN